MKSAKLVVPEEIARAFLVPETTVAQRSMRAQAKIRLCGDPGDDHPVHPARTDRCRQLKSVAEARAACKWTLGLTRQEPERRLIQGWLRELDGHRSNKDSIELSI